MTMIQNLRISNDFAEAARPAFARLLEKGRGRPDADLARDADYRMLHQVGMQLARSGGEPAIEEAIDELCRTAPHAEARSELERFWFCMGRWT